MAWARAQTYCQPIYELCDKTMGNILAPVWTVRNTVVRLVCRTVFICLCAFIAAMFPFFGCCPCACAVTSAHGCPSVESHILPVMPRLLDWKFCSKGIVRRALSARLFVSLSGSYGKL